MADCLQALQECSLIGLEDSPQLLGRSMILGGRAKQRAAHQQQQQGTSEPDAGADMGPADSGGARPGLAALMHAAAAAASGAEEGAFVDCSLPLFTSESPAIVGKQPPRSRFRRAAANAAPAGEGTAAAAAAAVPAAAQGGCEPAPAPSNDNCSKQQQPAPPQSLLMQLLDESSCSSVSCLTQSTAELPQSVTPTAAPPAHAAPPQRRQWQLPHAAPAAAAEQGAPDAGGLMVTPGPKHNQAWGSANGAVDAGRELTHSGGSDATGFKGFWAATPATNSRANYTSPAPMGQGAQQQAQEQEDQAQHGRPAPAAAAAPAAGQGRNNALLMLLSLEDSAALGNSSDHQASPLHAAAASPAHHVSEAAAADDSSAGGDDGSPQPSAPLMMQQGWQADAAAAGTGSRYTADFWASPGGTGSPAVLMSSPVLAAAAEASPGGAGRAASEGQLTPAEAAPASEVNGAAAGPRHHNTLNCSPIRGLTLWDGEGGGTPTAEQLLGGQQHSPVVQPQQQEADEASGGGGSQFQQLQLLLGVDSSDDDDWQDAAESLASSPTREAAASDSEQQPQASELAAAGTSALEQPEQAEAHEAAAAAAAASQAPDSDAPQPESEASTPVAASRPQHCMALRRASPAESVDSFVGAAAGEPYASLALDGSASPLCSTPSAVPGATAAAKRELAWCAYDGLGSLLEGEVPPTPATVLAVPCKNSWAAGAAGDAAAAGPPAEPIVAGVVLAGDACADAVTPLPAARAAAGRAGQHSAGDSPPVDLAAAVTGLKRQLREAEVKHTQQQRDVYQAYQLVMQKQLELERLRAVLDSSEQEGSSCLEALAAAMDILEQAADGSSTPGSEAGDALQDGLLDAAVTRASDAAAAGEEEAPHGSTKRGEAELLEVQQQCVVLQQHNTALQDTLAEAGQQLDVFEAQVAQLTRGKAALAQQLAGVEAQQGEVMQAELDEQQVQHEEEVGQLHQRLRELADQLAAAQEAAAAADAGADEHQAAAEELRQQLAAREAQLGGVSGQLAELQAALAGQADESAASQEQLSRQVAQLLAAKQELQAANAQLRAAEAEYASHQLDLGARNQELSKQLQDAVAAKRQLEQASHQLQAQNASLSQMVQSMRAHPASSSAVGGGGSVTSAGAAGGAEATPTSAATQSRTAGAGGSAMEGPTPMRRRMAATNAQLERRVQELVAQKRELAEQVTALQQQLVEQQGAVYHSDDAPTAAAGSEAQPGNGDDVCEELAVLQQQVEHLSAQNDDLLQQLEEVDWAHEQLQGEKLKLEGRLADLQAQQQQQGGDASNGERDSTTALLLQQLEADKAQLQAQLAELQAEQAQQQVTDSPNNTALFERCKELEAQVGQLQQRLARAEGADPGAAPAPQAPQQQQGGEQVQAPGEAAGLRAQLAQLQAQLAAQQARGSQEAELLKYSRGLGAELERAKQQLSKLQQDFEKVASSKAQLAAERARLAKVAADAEAGQQQAQQALAAAREQNSSLVEQLVQLQLSEPPPPTPAATAQHSSRSLPVTADSSAQTLASGPLAEPAAAAASAEEEHSKPSKRRWSVEAGVQAALGGAGAEQATAVQQLLLLQAQAQLQEMEEQNKQAAQRHVESKQRLAGLQAALTQQQVALQAAEAALTEAKTKHGRQAASLQRENEQLVQQLADARVQLQVLQAANEHLEGRVQQQQRDLEAQAAAAKRAQLQLQQLGHQQNLERLQAAATAAELQAAKDHAQQLLAARDHGAAALAAMQQQLQQAQQERRAAAAAAAGASEASAAAAEGRLAGELQAARVQVAQLAVDKEGLALELQQTKATVDYLEEAVHKIGQQNALLTQQLKDTLAAASSSSIATGSTAAPAASGAAPVSPAAATPTSAAPAHSAASAGGAAVSPRTLQSIIAAATRVNDKNKLLKQKLQKLQQQQGQRQ